MPGGHFYKGRGWSEDSPWGLSDWLLTFQELSWGRGKGRGQSQSSGDSLNPLKFYVSSLFLPCLKIWPQDLSSSVPGDIARVEKGYLVTLPEGQRASVSVTLFVRIGYQPTHLFSAHSSASDTPGNSNYWAFQLLQHNQFASCWLLLWQDRFQFLFLCFTKLVTSLLFCIILVSFLSIFIHI